MMWCVRGVALLAVLLMTLSCGGPKPLTPADERATRDPTPSSAQNTDGGHESLPADLLFRIDDPRVTEASGLARSTRHDGVLFTHNDKGAPAEVFAVDSSGTRAVLRLDVPAMDWEDIATTPDGRLWIADIGDNERVRRSVSISVVEEPTELVGARLRTTSYRFRYPDSPHDAEALLVHPVTARVFIVTKDERGGSVFVAPSRLEPNKTHLLEWVADVPANLTAGDFSPDGHSLVLRSYGRAYFYTEFGERPLAVSMPKQPQGEGIAFDGDGRHVLLSTEGRNSTILRAAIPEDIQQEIATAR
jgi:hypothetical protein